MLKWCVVGVLALACLFGGPAEASAAFDNQFEHTAFRASDGAPQWATDITQDAQGFLWFASNSGLLRFDGVHFDARPAHTFPTGLIQSVYATPDGDLWVGYRLGGVARLHKGRVDVYKFGGAIPSGTAFAFRRTPDGAIWLVCTNGVARFIEGRWEGVGAAWGYHGERLSDAFLTSDGSLMLLDADGKVLVLPAGGRRFSEVAVDAAETALRKSPRTQWWFYAPQLHGGLLANDHALWTADGEGLRREANGKTASFAAAQGLSSNTVGQLLEDREGNVWATTAEGVDRFRPVRVKGLVFESSVIKPAAAIDGEGVLWIGDVSGLHRLDLAADLRPERIVDAAGYNSMLATSPDGWVWIGNEQGIERRRGERRERIPGPVGAEGIGHPKQAITWTASGDVWLSVAGLGVFRRRDSAWQKDGEVAGLPDDLATVLATDKHDRVWIFYSDGSLARIEGGHARRLGAKEGFDVGVPTVALLDGKYAIAGGSAGVQLVVGDHFVRLHTVPEGALDGTTGIVEQETGDLWITANRGLIHIAATDVAATLEDPGHENVPMIVASAAELGGAVDKIRPLPSMIADSQKRLWINSWAGLGWLDPAHLMGNPVRLTPVIDQVEIDGVATPATDRLRIPAGTHRLRIEFTAAGLRSPADIRFEYRLDPVDTDWHSTLQRQIDYTNVLHGNYRFRLRVMNEDGVAGQGDRTWAFRISPAFDQTWWFRALVAIVAIVLIWLGYTLRLRHVLRQTKTRNMERARIARELHDTLLQSVQGLLLLVQSAAKASHEPVARERLQDAAQAAREVIKEGRDRVAALRAERQSVDLEAELADSVERYQQLGNATRLKVIVSGRPRPLKGENGRSLLLVMREAISNAHQHARASSIEVLVRYRVTGCQIRVRDDGRGFGAGEDDGMQEERSHWGIPGMRERLRDMGGRVRFHSTTHGTEVVITVPRATIYARRQGGETTP